MNATTPRPTRREAVALLAALPAALLPGPAVSSVPASSEPVLAAGWVLLASDLSDAA